MPMRQHDIPGPHDSFVVLPAMASAESTTEFPIFVAPWDCSVTSVKLTFGSAVVGDDTNRFNFNLINKDDDGTGTTELANLDLAAGTTVDAFVEETLLSTATDLTAGQILDLEYEKVSSGFDVEPVVVRVTFIGD